MNGRIEAIEKMLAEDGDDVFLHYSLAMEYAAAKDHHRAVAQLRRCIELDADYLPAYVEAGKCLRTAGDLAGAREVFQRGMDLAAARGETHTRDHIRQQIESLGQ